MMQPKPLPIDPPVLRDVVRQAVSSDTATLGLWHVEPVAYHNVAAAWRSIFWAASRPCAIVNNRDRYVDHTEQRWQRPIEQIVERWPTVTGVLLQRAAPARSQLPRSSSAHISC